MSTTITLTPKGERDFAKCKAMSGPICPAPITEILEMLRFLKLYAILLCVFIALKVFLYSKRKYDEYHTCFALITTNQKKIYDKKIVINMFVFISSSPAQADWRVRHNQ